MNAKQTGSIVPLYLMFAALVIGTRLMIVASYGNPTPVWDQWDAEIDRLYRPWLEGTLRWQDMFAAHNEHRVFVGRVIALALFAMNGNVLNPMLEMVANAVLHVGALLLLLHGVLKLFPASGTKTALVLFSALFFSIPLGVENILVNNSAMYLLFLFSLLFLLAITRRSEGSGYWDLVAVTSGLLACLSFASGAITLAAGVGILAIQWLLGVQRNRSSIVLMLVLLVMTIVSVKLTPTVAGHGGIKSRSVIDFLFALFKMTGGIVFFIPSLVFLFRQLVRRPGPGDPSWFLFGLFVWLAGQMLVIAYGRGHSNVLTSRYRDLYAIGYLGNLAALLLNLRDPGLNWRSWLLKAWLFTLCLGIGAFMPQVVRNLDNMRSEGAEYEARVSTYFATHDDRVLFAPDAKIPYPDAARLKLLLDQKTVKEMLPSDLFEHSRPVAQGHASLFVSILFLAGCIIAGAGTGIFGYLLFEKQDIGIGDDQAIR